MCCNFCITSTPLVVDEKLNGLIVLTTGYASRRVSILNYWNTVAIKISRGLFLTSRIVRSRCKSREPSSMIRERILDEATNHEFPRMKYNLNISTVCFKKF